MGISRRAFLGNLGLGVAGLGLGSGVSANAVRNPGDSEKLLVKNPDHPQPAKFDRLNLDWYKRTVQRLKEKVGEKGVDVILLQDERNLIYFTGLFHSTTERPFFAVFPLDEDALYWYHPGLDRDLVNTWWNTDNAYYFDFFHAEGGFPNLGQVSLGQTVDLFAWLLEGLKARGYGEKVIGVDMELPPSKMQKAAKILPKAQFVDISDICMKMRMVKTDEEIALTQRAMDYFSRIHAFARDFLLEKGTDVTDFEIGRAAVDYGSNLIMKDIKRDGKPHSAVGIEVRISCRTGVATGTPHPNQFFHEKVKKGDALQIAGIVRIGGYGGECYRYYQIAPWDAHREKVWQTVTDCVRIQEVESKAGQRCADIAYKIHKYQVENGMSKYIYHRPAHGEGMEGHQPPWLALGDRTVLEEGMTFSVEPGLYDPEKGFGYNPSDNLLVTQKKGVLMSTVPYTKEWMFLKL
ncbi:MAG: aminopeptidase P family protein [Candidatus Aminicenantes bacterium]|nr:aminopeptidase P family protein [Candidatus Aminicenantes bacterium]